MEPQISQICCRLRACYRTLDCQFVLENLAAKPPSYMSYMSYRAVLQSANQLISRALRRSARVFVENYTNGSAAVSVRRRVAPSKERPMRWTSLPLWR